MVNTKTISRILSSPRMLNVAAQGLVSGLIPALIGGGLLQAWLSDSGVDIKVIGLVTAVATPYTLKFLWAPLLDRFTPPFGRRKGWILISQACIILSVLYMSTLNPKDDIKALVLIATLVAYFGATLDIALDAWRREYLDDSEIALGLSANTLTFLISLRLIGGSLALVLADHISYGSIYRLLLLILIPAVVAIALSKEPEVAAAPPKKFYETVVLPFLDFFQRQGAIFLLLFILLYKLGDNMASALTTKFFLELTYTKTEIGLIGKWIGWISIALGSVMGGILVVKMRLRSSLFIFGIFQAVSTGLFALLPAIPHNVGALGAIIGFENLTAGLGTAAFATMVARLTNKKFTATQYALLTSVMGVPRYLSGSPTGFMVEQMGWTAFFIFCGLIAVPGIFLSLKIKEDEQGVISI